MTCQIQSIFIGAKEVFGFFLTAWEKNQKETDISHLQSTEDSNFSADKKHFWHWAMFIDSFLTGITSWEAVNFVDPLTGLDQ